MSVIYDLNHTNGKHWIIHFVQIAIRVGLGLQTVYVTSVHNTFVMS